MTQSGNVQPQGSHTKKPGLELQDLQVFENSIPGLGLPLEKPKAKPAKEIAAPKVLIFAYNSSSMAK